MMDTWDLMHNWHLVLPPSRPSHEQLLQIKAVAAGYDRSLPVAVLGSTPEFRDLLHEMGFRAIHVLERNMRFYEAMGAWRVYENPEQVVRGDWRDTLQALSSTYALILSDLTSGNIPYGDRARFYQLISDSLQPGGCFCDKVLTHNNDPLALESLFAKYSCLPVNLMHINAFSCEALFCSELVYTAQVIDSSRFYAELEKRAPDERVAAFVRHAPLITPLGCKWYYGRTWSELESDYCPELVRVQIWDDFSASPYFGRAKIFFLRKDI